MHHVTLISFEVSFIEIFPYTYILYEQQKIHLHHRPLQKMKLTHRVNHCLSCYRPLVTTQNKLTHNIK